MASVAPLALAISFAAAALDPAIAEVGDKVALLITASAYGDNRPDDQAGCKTSAQAIANRLREEKFTIFEAVDRPKADIEAAITRLDLTRSRGQQAQTFVYICGYAQSVRQRIFFLPALKRPEAAVRLETEGVLIRQVVRAMDGTNGTLLADLNPLPQGLIAPDDVDALSKGLPASLHVNVLVHAGRPVGDLGRRFAERRDGDEQRDARVMSALETQSILAPPPLKAGPPAFDNPEEKTTARAPAPDHSPPVVAPWKQTPADGPVSARSPSAPAPAKSHIGRRRMAHFDQTARKRQAVAKPVRQLAFSRPTRRFSTKRYGRIRYPVATPAPENKDLLQQVVTALGGAPPPPPVTARKQRRDRR